MSSTIPLTSAVTSGDESAVSALLANGADVNETTNGGQTPLILAVICGHTHIVQQLVQAGADPEQRDNLGLNAIDWAQRRGLREALDIFINPQQSSTPPKKITINFEEPEKPETREPGPEDEKSRRWIAGFKQRLDEQALRRLNRNEPSPEVRKVSTPEPGSTPIHSSRILTAPTSTSSENRKRCPKCNAVYNGDLLAYCAVDMTPLVDINAPIIPERAKSTPPLFWILLVVTLIGSLIAGSLITSYLYRAKQDNTRVAAVQRPTVIKGLPEVGPELAGKAVSLAHAECPVRGSEPVSGTVTVHVMIDKNGQVLRARGSGGDWLMRGAAIEAAMKSTFAPNKLRGSETEGTITYTFKP